jgi:hypothetical protein
VLGGSRGRVSSIDGHALPGRLPELSNFYCLPGRAGGSPLAIRFKRGARLVRQRECEDGSVSRAVVLGSVDIHAMARKAAERWMKAQKLVSVLS